MEPMLCQSSTAVAPMQNATTAYQEIPSIFSTVALILSQSFYQNLVLVNGIHPYNSRWLIEYCHTGNFGFPVLILICDSQKLLGSCCWELQNLFYKSQLTRLTGLLVLISSVVVMTICIYASLGT